MQPMRSLNPTSQLRGMAMNPSQSRDLTEADLSQYMGPVKGNGLLVNFFYKKIQTRSRDAATNGQIQTRLCVSKQPKGDRSTVACRYITEDQAKREFPVEFARFKEYEEIPTSGTPLDELPGISMSQLAILLINGLRSIEDLVDISDDQISQLGLDAIKSKKTAVAWLEKRTAAAGTINVSEIEAKYKIESDTYKAQVESQSQTIKTLEAQVAALTKMSTKGGMAELAAIQPSGNQQGGGAVSVDNPDDADLEYDISKMADPLSDGPDFTDDGDGVDGFDDLGDGDVDPLS